MQKTTELEAEVIPPTEAVAVRQAGPVGEALPAEQIAKPAITPAQAKVDAIAALTMTAYAKAASLIMTDEEIAKLQADFPDDAFLPGAAGKEHLIYIQHAHLRDRLNSVFRPGQWSIVPRNRWAEPFRTGKGTEGSRVYVEAMLVIRGAFVSEAIGEMEYYPSNPAQNYGDAVEGAKTAALRRCCKELGVGLQAWKKEWCDGWWQRRRSGQKPPATAPRSAPAGSGSQHTPQAPNAPAAPRTEAKPAQKAPYPTPESRAKMITNLQAGPDQPAREIVTEYFRKLEDPATLLPNEELENLDLRFVPATAGQFKDLVEKIAQFGNGERAAHAFPPHEIKGEEKPNKPAAAPTSGEPYDAEDAPWRSFPMPFGKDAGVTLADLDKKKLFGWWANYTVETEYNGKPKKPETIAKDRIFRAMLDEAGKHYKFEKNDR